MASTPRAAASPQSSLRLPQSSTGSNSGGLDRANTTPAALHDSWEEGDQTLREYRLRKAAREEARRRNRANSALSEGSFWDANDHSPSLAGSHRLPVKPPSPSSSMLSLSSSAAATPTPAAVPVVRPFSERSRSSTQSIISRSSASDIVTAPDFVRRASNSSTPLPALSEMPSIQDSRTSSGSLRSQTQSQRSLPRSMSSSSIVSQTRSIRSSAPPQMGHIPDIDDDPDKTTIALDKNEDTESIAAPSIIIHSEESSLHTTGSLSELEASRELESAAIQAELKKRRISARDDSDRGIPNSVVVGGKLVDIRGLDILEQVEMMRMADRERQEARAALAKAKAGATDSIQDDLENMKYTELSDIAERTECSTYSHRTSIAPTISEVGSRRPYAASHFVASSAAPSIRSSVSAVSSEAAYLSQAERIKHKYYKQETSSASPAGRQSPSGHRQYSSVGDTFYHSSSQISSSKASARSARTTASEVSHASSRSGMSPTKPPRGRGVHPLSSAHGAEDGRGSPTKRALSPVVASRLAQFDSAPSLSASVSASMVARSDIQGTSGPSKPSTPRLRTKSLSHDGLSAYAASAKSITSATYPAFSGLPMPSSKSTGDLVKLYEQKSSGAQEDPSARASPVKEWLRKISDPDKDSVASSTKSARIRSDAPSPASLRTPVNETGLLTPPVSGHAKFFSEPGPRSTNSKFDFDDAHVIYHGELYWLNSSSKSRPPFWQLCRAVLNKEEEIVVSWPGVSTGDPHTRRFDLKSCTLATSVRRNPLVPISTTSDQADSLAATSEEVARLQIFELTWPGRTQRFATTSLQNRIKWLGHIWQVQSRYSHSGSTPAGSIASSDEVTTIGSATLRSMDVALPAPGYESDEGEVKPVRHLEKDTQDSLYASVSQMLSPGTGPVTLQEPHDIFLDAREKQEAELPDIPRYQLSDPPLSPADSVRQLSSPLLPPKTRGAWSDVDRQSTKSAGLLLDAPPTRTVAREMKRLLNMMESQGSIKMSRSPEFTQHMRSMQTHLEGISKHLRQTSVKSKHSVENARFAEKVDEMMLLLHQVADEKQKTAASAVDDERAAGLQRLEGMIATLVERLDMATAHSTANNSPETNRVALSLPPVRQSIVTDYGNAANIRPSTPSITSSMVADIEKDALQWSIGAGAGNKRNATLPALPRSTSTSPQKSGEQRALGIANEAAAKAPSEVSAGHIRFERQNTAMRLEGYHHNLAQTKEPISDDSITERQLNSTWSADTPITAQPSRRPSAVRSASAIRGKRVPPPLVTERATNIGSSASSDNAPPTPKARDFAPRGPDPVQQSMLIQMNSMQELLTTLVASQAKHDESLKHQQQVSEYIQHLHEYLSNDREMRKEEFKTIKDSLNSMSDQIGKLPQEIQTLVQASIAIAGVQSAHAPNSTGSSSAGPAPDNDVPGPDSDDPPTRARQNSKPPATGGQAKTQGSSLLRKVSLGLTGGGPGSNTIRVGGPRKLGGPRLFGHPPAADTAEARNRWATSKGAREDDAPPFAGATDVHGQPGGDPQAPLMEALQGFEEQLAAADENGEVGNDQASVIAMGIMEILKMMKAQQAKDDRREQQKAQRQVQKEYVSADRHARELDAIRMEIRDWEAKRAELDASNRDPVNQEGIDTIIALLKDQMAAQEKLLVDMQESLTPRLANLDMDAKDAMNDVKEHMLDNLDVFRSKMDSEVKKTLEEVAALREQKKQLQSDLADLLAFKSKYGGGAPESIAQPRLRPPGPSYPAPTSDGGGPFPRTRGPR